MGNEQGRPLFHRSYNAQRVMHHRKTSLFTQRSVLPPNNGVRS
ncbi:hypothetical protein KSS87_006353 [Heliosperma pusillum]|nr:hypothetical protein KSS87_006353 [Heliosperma pusillum]